jgi:AcrR family transcriptional regulator
MARQAESEKQINGRESQKNRTRKALVASASELLRNGKHPTVTDAAEAAGISRATAYRYFPSQEMLWAEVALFAADGPLLKSTTERAGRSVGPGSDRRLGAPGWNLEL